MNITIEPLTLYWNQNQLTITAYQKKWMFDNDFEPSVRYRDGRNIAFSTFNNITTVPYQSGTF